MLFHFIKDYFFICDRSDRENSFALPIIGSRNVGMQYKYVMIQRMRLGLHLHEKKKMLYYSISNNLVLFLSFL